MNKPILNLALLGLVHGLIGNSTLEAIQNNDVSSLNNSEQIIQLNSLYAAVYKSMDNAPLKPSNESTKILPQPDVDPNDVDMDYHLMTEDELLQELNDEGIKMYNALPPEGKEIAREVASQRCTGLNTCKGRNACKTDANDCLGQGACKGQSKCVISDKNNAVKIAANEMAKKREEALKNAK